MGKGLLVTICAPSQGGKDFLMGQLMKHLKAEGFVCGNATAYKTRSARESDASYIRCVKSIKQIPVQQDNLIYSKYGDDIILYDKQEIESAISRGEIVFIATGIPDLASQIKAMFKSNCLSIFIKRQQVDKETMIREECKRHGFTKEGIAKAERTVNERIAVYESLKPKYVEYVQHEETGAEDTYLDAFLTAVGIANGILLLLRYNEQWIAWLICLALEAALYIISGSYIMLITVFAMLVNTIYGFVKWIIYINSKQKST